MAMKKKTVASGSDRGAQMKADAAKKKSQKNKALGYNGKTDLAGMNTNIRNSNTLPGIRTRTDQRATDQAKRAGVKAAKKANKK
jgi:hypothetical protein